MTEIVFYSLFVKHSLFVSKNKYVESIGKLNDTNQKQGECKKTQLAFENANEDFKASLCLIRETEDNKGYFRASWNVGSIKHVNAIRPLKYRDKFNLC